MSTESLPITLAAFAEAIKELPLSTVYAKASELRNSIAHLRRSNEELRAFVNESCDTEGEARELETYITENEQVMGSMNERISLLKSEIEGRGQQWIEMEDTAANEDQQSSSVFAPGTNGVAGERRNSVQHESSTVDTQNDQGQNGVYL
ncbi:hypothetical protein ETB97_009141 [Aspergillus alliaceus]|uniref:Uncharacterized protein n=1 Tax=Petromyces alliaceus TaxID=209559 RepID=A0A5N6FH71_PETAA|nr:uncharacterized protein BDW43DRAFT_315075 [Aspergillus alliaceus]KAB8229302.1 hypothetical protein BDW43DRAFT_315075 [Aspergillus alliaceus]KAE8393942.1 hypothetical protein BDV23DRAFT_180064 [Aspergillus alliaceus]KAF5863855.1 hypothetical protein ETB97_009141 [Aspergillus burnettii]